jgi:alpha-tubulin suppressor-like RCC1 family protein
MAVLSLVASCESPMTSPPDARNAADGSMDGGTSTPVCVVDDDCADEVFCNGAERCMPGATDADERGCVEATTGACAEGEDCDEEASTCDRRCVDADADGHGAIACGGDDCDDADANRFPGNLEVCDSTAHDEDCNPETFGFIDGDADGSGANGCCNVLDGGDLNCGADCNDSDSTVNERAGDGPPLFCDGVDNDCSATADEGCPCVEGETQECGTDAQRTRVGICRPGTQVCSGGAFTETCIGAVAPDEELCDGLDNDCDGMVDEGVRRTYYPDFDEDGFGASAGTPATACSAPAGYASNATDCDDTVASVNPGATEVCNLIDDNCTGGIDEGFIGTFYRDADLDGFGDATMATMTCAPPTGYVRNADDCDDTSGSRNPATIEGCNGIDDNCNGMTDEGLLRTFYRDADGDAWGVTSMTTSACLPPSGYTDRSGDCDDSRPAANPAGGEVCNALDDDCDGVVDEGALRTFYADGDGDSFGRSDSTMSACTAPSGHTDRAGDCNDGNAGVNPSSAELCNGRDDNCDGTTDPGCSCTDGMSRNCGPATDVGECAFGSQICIGGSWGGCVGAVTTSAEVCNGRDDDCDGMTDDGVTATDCYRDGDGDGHGTGGATVQCRDASRTAFGFCPVGWTNVNTDCNDGVSAIRPGATELCDGVDQDCDGMADEGATIACFGDADADGFGAGASVQRCPDAARVAFGMCPSGFTNVATDCNDGASTVRPGAPELCNDVDDDCDMSVDDGVSASPCHADADGDGFGAGPALLRCRDATRAAQGYCPIGYTNTATDCNDAAGTIRPMATETCNGLDDDCDGTADEALLATGCFVDGDSDGFGSGSASTQCRDAARSAYGFCPVGYTNGSGDCNDTNGSVRPMASESCNGVDDDCNGTIDDGATASPCYVDQDGDGYGAGSSTTRCRDASRAAQGYCPVGYTNVATDCNDANPTVRPGASETCNGLDDDCDGATDDGALLSCYPDADDDGYAAAAATAELLCPTPGRSAVGGCAINYTNRAPTSGNVDCRDGRANINPGRPDSCDGEDNDCSGTVDDAEALSECSATGGYAGCRAGECRLLACQPRRASCDGDLENGCETDLLTSDEHCGACGDRCPGGCAGGLCRPVVAIARGTDHACAVRDTGHVVCWGSNAFGQLGDGTTTQRTVPALVVGIDDAVDVAITSDGPYTALGTADFTCALRSTGQVACWGYLLGPVPANVAGVAGATQIDLGGSHGCAVVTGGAVYCWGSNAFGQLGRTAGSDRAAGLVPGVTAAQVTTGGDTTCARTTTGNVVCWGANLDGQRGDADTASRHTPGSAIVSGATHVHAGPRATCAIVGGAPTCWGRSWVNGRTSASPTPLTIPGVTGAVQVAIDWGVACAQRTDGTRACWGQELAGEFGDGPTVSTSTSGVAIPTPDAITDISSGGGGTCVLRQSGSVLCWGEGGRGELGDGTVTAISHSPARTHDLLDVVQVETDDSGDFYHRTCARRHDGQVLCWGMGQWTADVVGELKLAPIRMHLNAVDVAVGDGHICVVNAANRLRCWGRNFRGQLGDGTTTDRFSFDFVPGMNDVIALDAGSAHTCTTLASGQTYCFGFNGNGQSGAPLGPPYEALSPLAIPGVTAVDVSVGESHSCALARDGSIRCWGEGYLNGRTSRDPTAAALPGTDFLATLGGAATACGVTTEGQARCWGENANGQFGNGTASGSTATPTLVGTLSAIGRMSTGWTACATEGPARDLYCWGYNNDGQIGDGTATPPVSTPRRVGTMSGVSHLSSGGPTTCAVAADGLYCWGAGPLGDGTSSSSAVPVPVLDLYDP